MNRPIRRVLASSLVLAAALAGAPASADHATDAWKSLEDGHVEVTMVDVKDSDVPLVVVRAIIEQPPEKVWKIVSDCATYKEHMPNIAASKQLSKVGNKVTCQVTIAVPFPMPNLTATTEATHDEAPGHMKRSWRLIQGDYEFNTGSWEITAKDGGKASYVMYKVHAKPNASVPGFIKNMAQKKALPEMIERLRVEAAKVK